MIQQSGSDEPILGPGSAILNHRRGSNGFGYPSHRGMHLKKSRNHLPPTLDKKDATSPKAEKIRLLDGMWCLEEKT
jgi:hypothetical protein